MYLQVAVAVLRSKLPTLTVPRGPRAVWDGAQETTLTAKTRRREDAKLTISRSAKMSCPRSAPHAKAHILLPRQEHDRDSRYGTMYSLSFERQEVVHRRSCFPERHPHILPVGQGHIPAHNDNDAGAAPPTMKTTTVLEALGNTDDMLDDSATMTLTTI
ncbi:hypothetical protein EI94DRAFT_1899223 [Lactarius quietus]|nr:hypothetical protein EI94DRAFT_1899223 [Lactarius quietus]